MNQAQVPHEAGQFVCAIAASQNPGTVSKSVAQLSLTSKHGAVVITLTVVVHAPQACGHCAATSGRPQSLIRSIQSALSFAASLAHGSGVVIGHALHVAGHFSRTRVLSSDDPLHNVASSMHSVGSATP